MATTAAAEQASSQWHGIEDNPAIAELFPQDQFVGFYLRDDFPPDATPIVTLGGYGDGQRSVRKFVQESSEPTVGVVLPFTTVQTAEATATQGLLSVVQAINTHLGRDRDAPVDAAGYSLGGGIVYKAADAAPDNWRSVVGVVPFGIVKDRDFRLRLIRNRKANNKRQVYDPKLLEESFETADELFELIEYAKQQDVIAMLERRQTMGRRVLVVAGEEDDVFQKDQMLTALDTAGLAETFSVVPGGHSALAAAEGRKQLHEGIRRLLSVKMA